LMRLGRPMNDQGKRRRGGKKGKPLPELLREGKNLKVGHPSSFKKRTCNFSNNAFEKRRQKYKNAYGGVTWFIRLNGFDSRNKKNAGGRKSWARKRGTGAHVGY